MSKVIDGLLSTTLMDKAISSFNIFKHISSKIKEEKFIVVVDYTLPSNATRLFVVDLKERRVTRKHHVAHGKFSSDSSNPAKAIKFSNKIGSGMSSVGAVVTGSVYTGIHGKSLRLHGLSDTNSNMFIRAVVLHKSNYVTNDFINKNGYAGRSLGCLAIDPAIHPEIVYLLANGVFIYLHGG